MRYGNGCPNGSKIRRWRFRCAIIALLMNLVLREDDRHIPVMRPDYAVERFVEEDARLRYLPFQALYQHEIDCLDRDFPYPELTLAQVGDSGPGRCCR